MSRVFWKSSAASSKFTLRRWLISSTVLLMYKAPSWPTSSRNWKYRIIEYYIESYNSRKLFSSETTIRTSYLPHIFNFNLFLDVSIFHWCEIKDLPEESSHRLLPHQHLRQRTRRFQRDPLPVRAVEGKWWWKELVLSEINTIRINPVLSEYIIESVMGLKRI